MRVLELFSGTGSIGKICAERDHECISVDNTLPATINADILTWDYKVYPVGHFDLITASPVCAWWSVLRNSWIGRSGYTKESLQDDIDTKGKPMVDKVIEILNYFQPDYYWIENPQSGKMKTYITELPYYDVDYCMYANWGYKKRTRFWTNIEGFEAKTCNKACGNMEGRSHKKDMGGSSGKLADGTKVRLNKKIRAQYRLDGVSFTTDMSKETSKHDRYRIPPQLIRDLLDKM